MDANQKNKIWKMAIRILVIIAICSLGCSLLLGRDLVFACIFIVAAMSAWIINLVLTTDKKTGFTV